MDRPFPSCTTSPVQRCAVLCFVVIIYVVVLKALICNSECMKFHIFKLVENDLPSVMYSAKSSYKKKGL